MSPSIVINALDYKIYMKYAGIDFKRQNTEAHTPTVQTEVVSPGWDHVLQAEAVFTVGSHADLQPLCGEHHSITEFSSRNGSLH